RGDGCALREQPDQAPCPEPMPQTMRRRALQGCAWGANRGRDESIDRVFPPACGIGIQEERRYVVAAPRKYYSGRTCSLADPRSVVHLALKCSDIFEHVGLQTLLDAPALLQIAQDATDILARHPGHGSQVLPADPLVEQNASTTRVLADIVREFQQRAGNRAPHRQEARGGQGLVGPS